MALVGWCGHSAQLLTTVYEAGRSRQVLRGVLPEAAECRHAVLATTWALTTDLVSEQRALEGAAGA